ncbi:hypothetical protein [Nostoc flagelliforme]|nr:hypothetical protein [Nostoc flagelliforme]
MPITLYNNNLSLEITSFLDAKLPRLIASPTSAIEYSIPGAAIRTGTAYEPKYIWAINALLLPEESTILQAIYLDSELEKSNILISDTTQLLVERSPRTRAIVPGAAQPSNVGASSIIAYYANFNGCMIKPPELDERGIYIAASFTLQETTKVPA